MLTITRQLQIDLHIYNLGVEKARAAYIAETTARCRKCTRTAEPGITLCQSCRMSAVRRGKKRKEKKK